MCTSADIHLESGTCMVWKGTELLYLPWLSLLETFTCKKKTKPTKPHEIKLFKALSSYLHFKLINNQIKFKAVLGQMVQPIRYWV